MCVIDWLFLRSWFIELNWIEFLILVYFTSKSDFALLQILFNIDNSLRVEFNSSWCWIGTKLLDVIFGLSIVSSVWHVCSC